MWRVISYALVHQPLNIFHVIFTVVFLVWIGHQVEDLYGSKEYLAYFFLTTLLGGVAYTVVGAISPGVVPPLLGPSGAVTADADPVRAALPDAADSSTSRSG